MLDIRHSSARRSRLRDALQLPLRILLTTRGAPTQAGAYNVVGMVRRLLGRHGDERASRVILPFIYAGDATDEEIGYFVESPWLDPDPRHTLEGILRTGSERRVQELRVQNFPSAAETHSPRERWDVVHYGGGMLLRNNEPRFPLDIHRRDLGSGELRDILVAAECRLLIAQVETASAWANQLAEWIVDAGGPSVLVVESSSPLAAERFFTGFYLGILHDERLSRNVESRVREQNMVAPEGAVNVFLHLAHEGDHEWALDAAVESAVRRLDELQMMFGVDALNAQQQETQRYQHAARSRALNHIIATANAALEPTGEQPGATSMLEELNWSRESGGVVPLSIAVERIETLERLQSMVDILQHEEKDTQAPRVLNANFEAAGGAFLKANESLRPEHEYQLLVDIGPRWDRAQSIVSGHAEFPSEALPDDGEGNCLDVIFTSDQFEPQVASGSIWLPSRGRSHPIVAGQKSEKSGPIALQLKCPALPPEQREAVLHGRLSVYFENNLLQSAVVRATLSADGVEPHLANAIEVDFVLTGGLRDVGQLAVRRLSSSNHTKRPQGERISLNLTLNDDGGGTHRIIIPSAGKAAWLKYDPLASCDVLRAARNQLIGLFWKRDVNGNPLGDGNGGFLSGLDSSNAKDFQGFQWDLLNLAGHGSKLFALLFNNVRPPEGETAAEWVNALRSKLSQSSVIQIANTGAAQYVFPWALVYDFPLTAASSSGYRFCRSVREWEAPAGRPDDLVGPSCPFGDHDAHENRICPYGFWGLRHRIEQPPSLATPSATTPPYEPRREIFRGPWINLKAAFTSDAALDADMIKRHAERISGFPGMYFQSPAATNWNAFRQLLDTTQILYFLCHGEFDRVENEPYLGIGLRDSDRAHRIYPSNLSQVLINAAAQWRANAPLVLINGCHTANLEPGQIWNFVTSFVQAGASGVVGTEISVRLPVATEAAEIILTQIAGRTAVADAIWRMRWLLANKRNLIGLAYTPYCLADLRIG